MLRVPIRVQIEMVPQFIVACCVLHNVGKYLNDSWEDDKTDEPNEDDDSDGDYVPSDQPAGTAAVRTAGQVRREDIAEIVFRVP